MNATPHQVSEIIRLFHGLKNNTEKEIAKTVGVDLQVVTRCLNTYLASKNTDRYEFFESKMNNPDA